MALPTFGLQAVDWEQRIDYDELRRGRLARAKRYLEQSELGAVLCFDTPNIRYITATTIGTWGNDKLGRFCVLPRGAEPVMWDFGSAARHHQLYCPWLDGRSPAGISTMRGAMPIDANRGDEVADKVYAVLSEHGLADAPLGVDVVEPQVLFALQRRGFDVVDCQELMLQARAIKTPEEIKVLTTSCMLVDAAYERLYKVMAPGIKESELVAEACNVLYSLGSEFVEGVNAISGERCSPHPHIFSDRVLRPGDPAYFDIINSFNGYRTCYYRTFAVSSGSRALVDAYKKARGWIDASIELMRPGVGTDEVAKVWPKAEEFGFSNEMECFGLQFGHSVGLFLHERPIISRLNSLDHPVEIKEGMVIALETYCPAKDGFSAARIEEEVVVTADGPQVITRFPSDELFVANAY